MALINYQVGISVGESTAVSIEVIPSFLSFSGLHTASPQQGSKYFSYILNSDQMASALVGIPSPFLGFLDLSH